MAMTRRDFLKTSVIGTAGVLAWQGGFWPRGASAYAKTINLTKFIDPLPIFGGAGAGDIPLAAKAGVQPYVGVDYYNITAGWYRQQLHSELPAAGSRLYGYGGQGVDAVTGQLIGGKHLGNAIVATKGTPVRFTFTCKLPATHILPFDSTITQGLGITPTQDRAAVHLHGGLVPWPSDGGPFHWQSTAGTTGASVIPWLWDGTFLPDGVTPSTTRVWDYLYPNNQSARFMWYHDHAIGITRTTAYAGAATGYLIIDPADPVDVALRTDYGLGLILVFQDKVFWDPANDANYAMYAPGAQAGDLWYPYLYEKAIWKLQGNAKAAPLPSAIPEMFGDTMLVNGHVFPQTSIDATAYRLQTLNACNARFLNLKFVLEDPNVPGEPLGGYLTPTPAPVNAYMVGTEGGYLPNVVQIFANGVPLNPLNLTPWLQGPAERSDILVDFRACKGQKVLLFNDAPAPYPVGAPIFDWYPAAPGNPGAAAIPAGKGPNTRTIMRFNVSNKVLPAPVLPNIAGANPTLPTVADAVNGGLALNLTPGSVVTFNGAQYTYLPTTQELTLNETFDIFGRLMQLVGTNVPLVKGTYGRAYLDAPTEIAKYGTIQIWNIYNLTADTHPMHFHLFNVMVLRRRPIRVQGFSGIPVFTGPGRGPDSGEEGWKETVKMWPGECTTVAILVESPVPGRSVNVTVNNAGTPVTVACPIPDSPRLTGAPYNLPKNLGQADEYVWHCHILEHEEHDMMRPLVGSV